MSRVLKYYSALIFILLSTDVFAYEVCKTSGSKDIKWNTSNATFYINTTGGPVGSLSSVQRAMQTWTDVTTSSFTFIYGGSTSSTAHGINNGVNIITFGAMGINNATLAENAFWYNVSTGLMIDSDIKFNTSYTYATTGSSGAYDVQDVGTHEYGHSLCLEDLYNAADSDKTMYGYGSLGETKARTLDQDDINGIAYLYPGIYVNSKNPDSGISIAISPNDNNGLGNAVTPFSISYNNNTSVTLTAPDTSSSNYFRKWTGCNSTSGTICYATSDEAKTVTAIYGPQGWSSNINDSESGGCFIATAAYGSYLDPNVKILRDFRNEYLTNSLGKPLILFYYNNSPPIADFISQHEILRTITRWMLTPIVYGVKYPMAALILIICGISTIIYSKRKKLV